MSLIWSLGHVTKGPYAFAKPPHHPPEPVPPVGVSQVLEAPVDAVPLLQVALQQVVLHELAVAHARQDVLAVHEVPLESVFVHLQSLPDLGTRTERDGSSRAVPRVRIYSGREGGATMRKTVQKKYFQSGLRGKQCGCVVSEYLGQVRVGHKCTKQSRKKCQILVFCTGCVRC